jgi:purine nucleosidase
MGRVLEWMSVVGVVLAGFFPVALAGQAAKASTAASKTPQMVWIDTDIGDDIDDAFALGLILRSPELKVVGISTAFGDTETRARLVDRFLASSQQASGVAGIPVYSGVRTVTDNPMTQKAYAEHFPARKHEDGVAAMLEAIRAHPGEITLIGLGPLFNIGAAIGRDPATFCKLKRVVMMGGAVEHGYIGSQGEQRPAEPEWNIKQDPNGAAKLLASGVPIFMAPLDSTQIPLEAKDRDALFATGNSVTDQLTLLYYQWMALSWNHSPTPTLFDPLAAAYTFRPDLCPMTPMRLAVEADGLTRRVEGQPNVEVCLKSDEKGFLTVLLDRLEEPAK